MDEKTPKVLVIGAGISGIRCALDLAESGHYVFLVEKSPAVGGILNQLDYQFPDNHCGMCRMLPMINRDSGSQFCMRRGFFHENISVFTSTRVVSIDGNSGHLTVRLSRLPEGVDPERCTLCGECEAVCPVTAPDRFNAGIGERKAVYYAVPTRISSFPVIDWEICTRCNACVEACVSDAIDLDGEAKDILLEDIGGVILATGIPMVDPEQFDVYGYGVLPNVVTATEFERILSSIGPFKGKPVRPSDEKRIQRIAWIQCVGSRNVMIGADYCSNTCCMIAVKEAVLAKEKIGRGVDTTIFYMDMRTFGRDFQRYRDRAENELGVRFVRCRVHSIEPDDQPGDLKLAYVDGYGKQIDELFDLVVLSTGHQPVQPLSDFAGGQNFQEGLEVVSSAQGLTDISAAVLGADAASERTARRIREIGQTPAISNATQHTGDSVNIFKKRHRIQVVLCHEEAKTEQLVDWKKIETGLNILPGVLNVAHAGVECSQNGWEAVQRALQESHANRLILVANKPYNLWPRIEELYRNTGLLSSLVEVVYLNLPPSAHYDLSQTTEGALKAVEMAVNRLRTRMPPSGLSVPVVKTALVVGGGPSGMSAAAALAAHGISVFLVEKSDKLGGNLAHIVDEETRSVVEKLIREIESDSNIHIYFGANVVESIGSAGRFYTCIRLPSEEAVFIDHGVFIVATGGRPSNIDAYGFGGHESIMTQFELEKRLSDPDFSGEPLKTVVMIQCAGSREEPRNYCSRICCLKAIKNAIKIKERHPKADVFIFYRDMMTYGESERFYTRARKKGVLFIPFDTKNKPQVSIGSGGPVVEGVDPILGTGVQLKPELLALSSGLIPNPVEALAQTLRVETTRDGFIKEADSKWRPVDTGREGIFVCGLARNPATVKEAVEEGEAAAQRALRILSRQTLKPQRTTARIRHSVCAMCEMCITACMYGARFIDKERSQVVVDPAACQGCGTCAAVCPSSATVIGDFEDGGVMNAIEAAL